MSVFETLGEERPKRPARVRLLAYVLSYDDLLADGTFVARVDPADPVTIGRAYDDEPTGFRDPTELRLQDRWASGGHAVIDRKGDADVVRDVGSRNGTWVNGERITEHRLEDGDLLEVGHSLFCWRVVDESLAAALDGKEPPRLGPTRTCCPEVAALRRELGKIAPSNESVLILAETGAGKEIVAEAVHELSGRRGAYCTVDCGAVPESLFEATFFGHRRGAFTGAEGARVGEIATADRGTLFLDEVANMNLTSQGKLLRVLEDGKVTPLGSTEHTQVDVRWIAATNRDLFAGEVPFRDDLLRRLAGYVARIPPLRRRREDLGSLAAHLLRQAGIEKAAISAAAGRKLFTGRFPGNIRELRTTLRSAAILAGAAAIDLEHLPKLEAAPEGDPRRDGDDDAAGASRRGTPSAEELTAALAATGGNVVRAAQKLGTHARQLYRWIEKLGIDLDKYRPPGR